MKLGNVRSGSDRAAWLLFLNWISRRVGRCLLLLFMVMNLQAASAGEAISLDLRIPKPADHSLLVLSPNLLELTFINTKPPGAADVDTWAWVDGTGSFVPPDVSKISVVVAGQTNTITGSGFKRRPIYAPQANWDLRIGNHLFLQLADSISEDASVQVLNDGSLWPTNMNFATVASPLRYSPAIHVNQEGYLPAFPKKAVVGYYLGSLGEMPVTTNRFFIVNAQTSNSVYEGTLTSRHDVGYTYTPTPYQEVCEADFTAVTTPGEYRVVIPGLGASLPFRIDDGIGMDFARTYALGLFHQRSGVDVSMPFTRFTHAADHVAPATVPLDDSAPFGFTWTTISNYASEIDLENPPQVSLLTNSAAQLFPFVNPGPVEVSGGHFEAGDYNRVTYNSAQLIHTLMFAADALPGVGELDNLGIPESGDGISDVLQEAKWEADFLAKMQDDDGGFYYSVYSQDREYESDVLPENGDPQVVWPKNTVATAAAVAALAQCASSPLMKQAYPQAAENYWAKAQLGWKFLTNAIAVHGRAGAYQDIQHFGGDFTDQDELAWAACEMFLATGDSQYRDQLYDWFPDPTDPATMRWGWWRMYVCYGNAIRDYATAARSGRLSADQLDADYLAKCVNVITNCGNDNLRWSQENAYGSSFPDSTKGARSAGWYFSPVQAFDLMAAQLFNPNPEYVDAILLNLNYEAGCNPLNVSYITGLGWKRQREIVDQYSGNDRHVLPKDGIPVSNLQEGFVWTFTYGWDLSPLCFPSDGAQEAPYPVYDRWCDFFNVTTESSTTDTARSFAVAAWLAAQTPLTNQPWRATNATLLVSENAKLSGQPVTVALEVANTNLTGAKIIWEARDQAPAFGDLNYTFTPAAEGPHWIEAEVQWPDGRRAFAVSSVFVSNYVPPVLNELRTISTGGFSFNLSGTAEATYWIQTSTNLINWETIATNTLPANGQLQITDPTSAGVSQKFYRAVKAP